MRCQRAAMQVVRSVVFSQVVDAVGHSVVLTHRLRIETVDAPFESSWGVPMIFC